VSKQIAIIVEGDSEKAFRKILLEFLTAKLGGQMPKLKFIPEDHRIPTGDKLKRDVDRLLATNDAVIALTDVYTGSKPPDFTDAADAKRKMRQWVGDNTNFHPHAAQYEFEAWLLPYWRSIQQLTGKNRGPPASNPETVDHDRPPSEHLRDLFRGSKRGSYSKTRDAARILRGQDLEVSAALCPELRAFLDTIIQVATSP
jgi:hypothetical protein